MGEAPPLVGVAVNVTDWPAQVGLAPDVIAIATAGVHPGWALIYPMQKNDNKIMSNFFFMLVTLGLTDVSVDQNYSAFALSTIKYLEVKGLF